MTKKMKTTTDTVLNKAEVLLKDLEAASRGRRLRAAENEVKNAAKPTSRSARLRAAEGQVKAAKPRDHRLCWSDMKTD
jgi:capsule polysaccharide export protein KpsE/RkpR